VNGSSWPTAVQQHMSLRPGCDPGTGCFTQPRLVKIHSECQAITTAITSLLPRKHEERAALPAHFQAGNRQTRLIKCHTRRDIRLKEQAILQPGHHRRFELQFAANVTAKAGGARLTGSSVGKSAPQKPACSAKSPATTIQRQNPQSQAKLGGPGGIRTHDVLSEADYESAACNQHGVRP
jgi:hypothetical protein